MNRIQWLIPTTTIYFTTWFNNNWERFRTVEYDSTLSTHVTVMLQNPKYYPNNENLVVIHIDATSTYENSEKETAIGYPDIPGEVITIKVLQVDKERIELDIECNHQQIWEQIVHPFLGRIQSTWNVITTSEQGERVENARALVGKETTETNDASLFYKDIRMKKTIELKRNSEFQLDIIDAATYRALQKLHIPVRKPQEDDDFLELLELVDTKKYAVRDVLTLGSVFYRWFSLVDGNLTGLGGIQLRKQNEKITEILLFAPQSHDNYADSLDWSLAISKYLEEEGYLTRKPRAKAGGKENIEGQAKTFVDEPWPTNPDLLKPHLERIVHLASLSDGSLNGIEILREFKIGEHGKQFCIGWDNFSMLGHIEIVPSTHTLSQIKITSYDQGNFPEWQQLADDFLSEIANELERICVPEKTAQRTNQIVEQQQPLERLLNFSDNRQGAILPGATIIGGNDTGGTVFSGTTNRGEHYTLIVSPDGSQRPIQDAAMKVVEALNFQIENVEQLNETEKLEKKVREHFNKSMTIRQSAINCSVSESTICRIRAKLGLVKHRNAS